jgi:asparagine synthase (glutamine-hydrolysing)
MCGIAGIFHRNGQRAVDRDVLTRMARSIQHRGPDDEGFFVEGSIGFGSRRLSIVDRALGHQPLANEDGRLWITFNGEIYNHPELSRQLAARGHVYRTHCDTETALHAYEEYGMSVAEHLRGMFAFAIWDGPQKRLLLVRDRLGIKPLYYCQQGDTFLFASEVKALLEYGFPFGVEEEVLECYLRLGYVPGELTLFRGIRKLLPGHVLIANSGQSDIEVRRYWSPRFEPREDLTEERALEEFRALLEETVAQHRLGEVPQGIFLSGGVDSSALLAITAGQVNEPAMTFSVGYEEAREESEFAYARTVAKKFGARHFEHELSGKNFADSLSRLIWHMDEPVADPAAIPLFFIAQLAKEHITVVHSGEGADEILAGYSIYGKMERLSAFQRLTGPLGSRLLAGGLGLPFLPERIRRYAELANKPLSQRYQGVRRVLTAETLGRISRNGFFEEEASRYRREFFRQLYRDAEGYPDLNQMLSVDLQTWLPDDLLVKADKMTMAASIELRVPFLDHIVVEFAAGLPCHFKRRKGQSKYLLKTLMRPHLPAEILDAPKRGFPIPLRRWLAADLYKTARAWLLDSPFLARFFVRSEMEKLLESHRSGPTDLSGEIYGLACISIWHDTFGKNRTA